MRILKILFVEDCHNERGHLRSTVDSDAGVEKLGWATFSASLSSALLKLDPSYRDYERPDGIITDIFMPEEPDKRVLIPGGVSIALRAEELGIPFVLCTSGYHHGPEYNWICGLGRRRGWPEMVDEVVGGKRGDEGTHKDWAKAIEVLRELIGARNGPG